MRRKHFEESSQEENKARIRLKLAIAVYTVSMPEKTSYTAKVSYFAAKAVVRAPRTVHRWLGGESPIPKVVQRVVDDILVEYHTTI